MKRWIAISFFAPATAFLALSTGCGGGSGSAPPVSSGYYVITTYGPVGAQVPNGSVQFEGTSQQVQIQCTPGVGDCVVDTGAQITNSNGAFSVATDDIPDYWGFQTVANANCNQDNTYPAQEVLNQQTVTLQCNGQSFTMVASPSGYVYGYGQSNQPPTSITITATNVGFPASPLPTIDSYNESAQLETEIQATSVSQDQLSVTFPTNSAILSAGNHILVVTNASGQAIGAAPFAVFYVTPPSPPPCGGPDTQETGGVSPLIRCTP